MSSTSTTLPPGDALPFDALIAVTPGGIASRVLARTDGGTVTLFAFDGGQGLSEHTTPFDALAIVLRGALAITVGGTATRAVPGTVVRLPAGIAHAVEALEPTRMLLVMLR